MIDLQALVDGIGSRMQKERAATQMTLGALIARLAELPPETEIRGLSDRLMSYRGYYSDLAIEPSEGSVRADALLAACRAAMGREFTGYKGGEFVMGERTPMWVAGYGDSGCPRLMGIADDGTIQTELEE